jgi:phage terminase small subunit
VSDLTARQQRFVDEYLCDLNATQAAIRAGYSPKAAQPVSSRLLSNAMVSKAVADAQAARASASALSEHWVLDRLRENVERSMQATPVLDDEGNQTGMFVYQGTVANRSLELIGKHRGMFVERREVTGPKGGAIVVRIEREGRRIVK